MQHNNILYHERFLFVHNYDDYTVLWSWCHLPPLHRPSSLPSRSRTNGFGWSWSILLGAVGTTVVRASLKNDQDEPYLSPINSNKTTHIFAKWYYFRQLPVFDYEVDGWLKNEFIFTMTALNRRLLFVQNDNASIPSFVYCLSTRYMYNVSHSSAKN